MVLTVRKKLSQENATLFPVRQHARNVKSTVACIAKIVILPELLTFLEMRSDRLRCGASADYSGAFFVLENLIFLLYNYCRLCGCSTTVSMLAFQAGDGGSIPLTRSKR